MEGSITKIWASILSEQNLAVILALFIGYLSAFVSFSMHFKDKLKFLFFSWEAQCYSFLSGLFAWFTFELVKLTDISVSGMSFKECPFIFAVIIGVVGQKLFLSFFKSKGNIDEKISEGFDSFFDKIQSYLFYRYAVRRQKRLHNEITKFMGDFPFAQLNELIFSCQKAVVATEINDNDNDLLVNNLNEIFQSNTSEETTIIHVCLELAKYIDVEIIKQFADKVKEHNEVNESKNSALDILNEIQVIALDQKDGGDNNEKTS